MSAPEIHSVWQVLRRTFVLESYLSVSMRPNVRFTSSRFFVA